MQIIIVEHFDQKKNVSRTFVNTCVFDSIVLYNHMNSSHNRDVNRLICQLNTDWCEIVFDLVFLLFGVE